MQRFAFMIHPLKVKDIARKFPLANIMPESVLEGLFRRVPPLTVSKITGIRSATGAEAEGWFVACPMTARQMVELPEKVVLDKIIQTGRKAEELGAPLLGLGAFTAVVGDAGITVARALGIPVTTGNSYTVATALEGIEYAANLLGQDLQKSRIAVLGATGSIGKACARILASQGRDVELVGRDRVRLEELAAELRSAYGVPAAVSTDLSESLPRADVVVAVTSAIDAVVRPEDLKRGAIVCDVSRPRNVSVAVAEARDDVFVFEGGVIEVPGQVDFGFNFGFPPGTAYACMSETMILALENRYESFSLGRDLDVDKIREIQGLAAKHGFRLAGLRSFERAVTDEHIHRVRVASGRVKTPIFVSSS